MATEYKALSASTAAGLTTAINVETSNGYYVSGSISSAIASTSINNVVETYAVLMHRQTE